MRIHSAISPDIKVAALLADAGADSQGVFGGVCGRSLRDDKQGGTKR